MLSSYILDPMGLVVGLLPQVILLVGSDPMGRSLLCCRRRFRCLCRTRWGVRCFVAAGAFADGFGPGGVIDAVVPQLLSLCAWLQQALS